MPVLQQQHHGLPQRELLEQLPHAQEDLAPQRLAVEVLHALLLLGREAQSEHGGQVGEHLGRAFGEQVCQARGQLAPGRVLRVVLADVEAAAQDLDERPVAEAAPERHRAPFEPQHRAARPAPADLGDEARLAGTRLAGDDQRAALAAVEPIQRVLHDGQLPIAADQRRADAEPPGARLLAFAVCARQLEDRHGFLDALERLPADRRELEERAPRRMHRLARVDLAGPGRLLQARRDVGGVADRGVVHAQVVADLADHDHAGVDAHADPHRAQRPRGLVAARRGFLQLVADADCREQRPPHMILVRQRCAEQRHEAVAEKLVDRAFEAMDLAQRELEKLIQQRVHRIRAHALHQLGRVRHVAEQHGHLLALAFERRVRGEDLLREVRRGVDARLRGHGCGRRSGCR